MNNTKISLLLLVLLLVVSACSRGPQSSIKLNFSLDYQVVLATNKVRVFPVKSGSNVADRVIDYDRNASPMISLPAGVWTFYSVEWNGSAPYTGALRCGISDTLDLKGVVDTEVNITANESNCGAAFFASVFDNYCYKPSETATTTPFRSGSGTIADPYIICSVAQLNAIGGANFTTYRTNHFKLGRDINFHHKFDNIPEALPFIPIGDDVTSFPNTSTLFTGSFDGAGHSILGMNLDIVPASATSTISNVGFVRSLGGTIKNLTFIFPEIDIGDDNADVNSVGIVAGKTDGPSSISNVHVKFAHIRGKTMVGGLVGNAYWSSMASVKISDSSFFDGEVQGKRSIGGLVGEMMMPTGDDIVRSFSNGRLHMNDGYCLNPSYKDQGSCTSAGSSWTEAGRGGGLVGLVNSTSSTITPHIRESFSTMDIQGQNEVGGLVGRNNSSMALTIVDSYALGNIHSWGGSTSAVGGILGYNQTATFAKMTRVFHTQGGLSSTASGSSVGRIVGGGALGDCYESFATGYDSIPMNCSLTNSASTSYVGIRDLTTFQGANWPIQEIEAAVPMSKIALGFNHSCGINSNGKFKCWGANANGQLGVGSTASLTKPASVDNSTTYSSIAAGTSHSCARTNLGAIKCWGDNLSGQFGNGNTIGSSIPTETATFTTWATIATGDSYTCAIDSSKALYCWGANTYGQIGNGSTTTMYNPTLINSGVNYSLVATGLNFTCGLTDTGTLKCWGKNTFGQLGNGTTTDNLVPFTIGSGYTQIATGSSHSCAITSGGVLRCWGNNSSGQLGVVSATTTSPLDVDTGVTYSKVATGAYHTCAITTTGVLKCWGNGASGQLGNNSITNQPTPIIVDAGINYYSVSLGANHTCGITTDGITKCWGGNTAGQLADGTLTDKLTPITVNLAPVWVMADNGYSLVE